MAVIELEVHGWFPRVEDPESRRNGPPRYIRLIRLRTSAMSGRRAFGEPITVTATINGNLLGSNRWR